MRYGVKEYRNASKREELTVETKVVEKGKKERQKCFKTTGVEHEIREQTIESTIQFSSKRQQQKEDGRQGAGNISTAVEEAQY
jgi:uncharacterized protein (DUF362 family)